MDTPDPLHPVTHDHYCRPGDAPCPDRAEREDEQTVEHPDPPSDASVQCRTCRWSQHCFNAGLDLSEVAGEPDEFGEIVEIEPDDVPYRDPELDSAWWNS